MSRNKSQTQNPVTTHSFLPLKPLERHSFQWLGSRPVLSNLWLFPVYLYSKTTFFFFNPFPSPFIFPDWYILWDIFVTPDWKPKSHSWTSGTCPKLSHLSKSWLVSLTTDNNISFIYLLVWKELAALLRRIIYHEDSCGIVCGRWKYHRPNSVSTHPKHKSLPPHITLLQQPQKKNLQQVSERVLP